MRGELTVAVAQEEVLWVEKYRPRSLDDIVNQKEIVERLKKFVAERNMPHLLFAGLSGTGKTTAALGLVHDLYGDITSSTSLN
jgi:replication factor C small subunit